MSQLRRNPQGTLYYIIGIAFSGFALKSFLVPNHLGDGGIKGISLLTPELTDFKLAIIIAAANVPFIIMGALQIDYRFAFKTLLCVIGLGLVLTPLNTTDKLLISIFAGFLMGLGMRLVEYVAIKAFVFNYGVTVAAGGILKRHHRDYYTKETT